MKHQNTLRELVIDATREEPTRLREIYAVVMSLRPGTAATSVRARVYDEMNAGRIIRIAAGVYLAASGPARLLLVEGDAWDVLKAMPSDVLDGAFIDPPWLLGTEKNLAGTTRAPAGARQYELRDLDVAFFREAFRVLKKSRPWNSVQGKGSPVGGAALVILTPPRTAQTRRHLDAMLGLAESCGFVFQAELAVDYSDKIGGYWPPQRSWLLQVLTAGPRAGVPWDLTLTSVFTTKRVKRACVEGAEEHEAEKPVDVWLRVLSFISRPGDLVADFFGGRARWARPAVERGWNVLVVEKEPRWVVRIRDDWPAGT